MLKYSLFHSPPTHRPDRVPASDISLIRGIEIAHGEIQVAIVDVELPPEVLVWTVGKGEDECVASARKISLLCFHSRHVVLFR